MKARSSVTEVMALLGWWGIMATVAFVGGYFGWIASDREVPVAVISMSAATEQVQPGGVFRAHYRFIRTRSCGTHVERLLFDGGGQRFVLPDLDFAPGTLPIGEDIVFVPAAVPPGALPGTATYRTVNCYVCNPSHLMWPICDAPRDIKFQIVPRGASQPPPALQ